jgi:predicted Holliday junction resolvase-like endonuclease
MSINGLAKDLVSFFKTARFLWGRCPHCDQPFRLSDARVSSSPNPPRDWLRRMERQQADIDEQNQQVALREMEVGNREGEVREAEYDVRRREDRIERDSKRRVQEILKSKTEIQGLIRAASRDAVKRSRATLLGRLLERMAPCFRKFAYDPRDMRSICDPFDYVLFDGLTVERQVKEIVFIEVKCGRGRLSNVQRGVVQAVDKGRIHSEVWEIGNPDIPITKQMLYGTRRALPPTEEDE